MFEKPTSGLCVDASTSGNPGPSQFQAVNLETGEITLLSPKFYATNNVAEFLGLINALHYCFENGIKTLYTDSNTAISWLTKGDVNTKMVSNSKTLPTWNRVFKALEWLKTVQYVKTNGDAFMHEKTKKWVNIEKWLTSEWGEIPADFGNK